MENIIIRTAEPADLPALTDIYNDAVIHTTATLDLEPRSVEDRRSWFEQHNKGNHPLIVAVLPAGEQGGQKNQTIPDRQTDGKEQTVPDGQADGEEHTVPDRQVWKKNQTGQVVGYASLSDLFDKDAYISTVELSIYVHPDYKRQGIGDRLMREILQMAREDATTHSVVSKITSGNAASDRLHEKYGFVKAGTLHECAWKFGMLLDMDMYELLL